MELRCGAVDENQSHRLSFGLDSPTFRFGPCKPSCSFLTSTSHSTGVLFRAVQLRRMLQSCAIGASVCFEAGSKQSLLDLAIADSVCHSCAVRSSQSSPAVIGCDAKHVRDATCMAGRLITSGAIIQACGWIRPPVASAPAIPPSAASSLRPVAAPVCFSLQRRCGKSWWQGLLKGVVSRHLLTSRQEGKQSLVDYAITDSVPCRSPYRCAVSSSPTAEVCLSMQVRELSCAAGLLMKTRAIVSVSGWIRPPKSARASPPAASSLPPATAPVFFPCSAATEDASENFGRGICLFRGRKASSLSWTLRLQIPCVTVVL